MMLKVPIALSVLTVALGTFTASRVLGQSRHGEAGVIRISQWDSQAGKLRAAHNWSGLLSECSQWTQAEPGNPTGWACLAYAQCQTRQSPQVFKSTAQRALSLQPSNPGPWWLIASCYGDQKDFGGAVTAEQSGIKIAPNSWRAWYGLGMAWHNLGEAAKIPSPGVRVPAGDPASFWRGAASAFERAGQLNAPASYSVWTYAGGASYYSGDYRRAIRDYLTALRINRDDQYAHSGLFQSSDALRRACTRTTPGLRFGNVQEFRTSWICDASTTSLLQQARQALN